jgi:hypothetical protein
MVVKRDKIIEKLKLSGKDVSFVDMTAGEVVSSRSA